ncbi:MAG: hypothetical protein AAGD14_05110 [Planctomycetota bacterium]
MSGNLGIYSELELKAAKDLIRELVRALRGVRLYSEDHPTLEGMVTNLRKRWEAATAAGPLALRLTEGAVLLEDVPVYRGSSLGDVLPGQLYDHGVVGLIFKRGLEPEEARRLIEALAREPDDEGVDYALLLWEADLNHVQVLLDAEETEDEEFDSPEAFARRVASFGDESDPPMKPEFDEARRALRAQLDPPELDPELFQFTEREREALEPLLANDGYRRTLRHALRVLHAMAYEQLDPEEGITVEHVTGLLVERLAGTGDLPGLSELLERSEEMCQGQGPIRQHFAEYTLATAREHPVVTAALDGLERVQRIEAPDLALCLARLGPEAALPFAQWLGRTKHAETAREAMRVMGPEAERVLVELYASAETENRGQLRPALIDLGTHDALAAIADESPQLEETTRLEIVRLGERSTDPRVRRAVTRGLRDPSPRVRLASIKATRRSDAAAVAEFLREQLAAATLDRRPPEESRQLFEMLGRIGDGDVAMVLASQCRTRGLAARFKKPTPFQEACLVALRRMRAPDAKRVVDELADKAPSAFRELLEDGFDSLG